jgi:hypothetical protein
MGSLICKEMKLEKRRIIYRNGWGKMARRVGDFTTCNIRQSLNFGVISSRKPSFFQEPKNHIETKPEDI